jgi:hypothetical protein
MIQRNFQCYLMIFFHLPTDSVRSKVITDTFYRWLDVWKLDGR